MKLKSVSSYVKLEQAVGKKKKKRKAEALVVEHKPRIAKVVPGGKYASLDELLQEFMN